ncbi:CLUMA_CG014942, isoform A [Clunio marinus]|uniref:CLUMA_CG014942, isoform A n=1 Tax=Clunio marinus TaxID=568069 RepID=A0A1J1IRL8_9DIPT|nr:CLUMA_CG014942, isoform A [Clunio marinus]
MMTMKKEHLKAYCATSQMQPVVTFSINKYVCGLSTCFMNTDVVMNVEKQEKFHKCATRSIAFRARFTSNDNESHHECDFVILNSNEKDEG